jgi:hypothetical protein
VDQVRERGLGVLPLHARFLELVRRPLSSKEAENLAARFFSQESSSFHNSLTIKVPLTEESELQPIQINP